jgi:hypothetical protein
MDPRAQTAPILVYQKRELCTDKGTNQRGQREKSPMIVAYTELSATALVEQVACNKCCEHQEGMQKSTGGQTNHIPN